MKRIIVVLVIVMLLAGCTMEERESKDVGWSIIKSPNTGRYYEVISRKEGYSGYMAMSEVTQLEYDEYMRMKR